MPPKRQKNIQKLGGSHTVDGVKYYTKLNGEMVRFDSSEAKLERKLRKEEKKRQKDSPDLYAAREFKKKMGQTTTKHYETFNQLSASDELFYDELEKKQRDAESNPFGNFGGSKSDVPMKLKKPKPPAGAPKMSKTSVTVEEARQMAAQRKEQLDRDAAEEAWFADLRKNKAKIDADDAEARNLRKDCPPCPPCPPQPKRDVIDLTKSPTKKKHKTRTKEHCDKINAKRLKGDQKLVKLWDKRDQMQWDLEEMAPGDERESLQDKIYNLEEKVIPPIRAKRDKYSKRFRKCKAQFGDVFEKPPTVKPKAMGPAKKPPPKMEYKYYDKLPTEDLKQNAANAAKRFASAMLDKPAGTASADKFLMSRKPKPAKIPSEPKPKKSKPDDSGAVADWGDAELWLPTKKSPKKGKKRTDYKSSLSDYRAANPGKKK